MTLSPNTRLLASPKELEVYPYRRVWRSIIIEVGLLFSVAIGLFVLVNWVGVVIPPSLRGIVNLALALLPALLWYSFSYVPERLVPRPRPRLGVVFVITLFLSGSIGLQVVEQIIQPERWLALASASNRILGYTLTIGVLQEFLKYAVIRTVVWPELLRIRADSIAYGAATAVSYGTVLNVSLALTTPILPDAFANRVFSQIAIQLGGSIVLAYALAETKFISGSLFLLPLTFLLSALVTGIAIPLRSGLINASIALPNAQGLLVSSPRPLFGLVFSLIVIIVPIIVVSFLFNNADRRLQDIEAQSQ